MWELWDVSVGTGLAALATEDEARALVGKLLDYYGIWQANDLHLIVDHQQIGSNPTTLTGLALVAFARKFPRVEPKSLLAGESVVVVYESGRSYDAVVGFDAPIPHDPDPLAGLHPAPYLNWQAVYDTKRTTPRYKSSVLHWTDWRPPHYGFQPFYCYAHEVHPWPEGRLDRLAELLEAKVEGSGEPE